MSDTQQDAGAGETWAAVATEMAAWVADLLQENKALRTLLTECRDRLDIGIDSTLLERIDATLTQPAPAKEKSP